MKKRWMRLFGLGAAGLVVLCAALVGAVWLNNRSLPAHSAVVDRLSDLQKSRLAEANHLRQSLGSAVWPGWEQQDIPMVVYNESYAFLVGYSGAPAQGWVRMPQNQPRGQAWEVVPGDTFEGSPYYRQLLPDPKITPENFTALVGKTWVVTMETRDYMEVSFYSSLQEGAPAPLRPVIPYRLAWGLIMGATDTYIDGLEHEAFHALQGAQAPERLAAAEAANKLEERYPWDNTELGKAWSAETGLLVQAARAASDDQALDLARRFLAQRDQRRSAPGMDPDLADYERQREWLEGLAKYAELTLGKAAGAEASYQPLAGIQLDPAFKLYAGQAQYWSEQIDEALRTAGRSGETRFYYTGFVQAVLLDRLLPGWKEQAFQPGVFLDDLLRQAAAP